MFVPSPFPYVSIRKSVFQTKYKHRLRASKIQTFTRSGVTDCQTQIYDSLPLRFSAVCLLIYKRHRTAHVYCHAQKTIECSPSSEADICSPRQEIPRLLYDPTVHYRVRNSPPVASICSQMNPIHITTTSLSSILNTFPYT
jgi:hypothetical protein